MNYGRIIIGGLLAGLVMNIGEFLLNDMVIGTQMKAFFAEHGFKEPGGSFIIVAVLMTFIVGIVAVWLYALIRPRVGAGPKAAIIAAVVLWFAVYLYPGVINMFLFGIPMNMMIIAFVWGLVEYVLATIAGAWAYKEA